MKKRLLYLHGYQGAPNLEKVAYMESLGFDVIAPHIDYDNRPDIISELAELEFDYIIGNSLGSYVGFYLSEIKRVECLLINAPMYMNIMEVINCQINVPGNHLNIGGGTTKKNIVLGRHDDIVNHVKVIEWLDNRSYYTDIHVYDGMGHVYTNGQFVDSVQPILMEVLVSDSHNIYRTT